LALIRINYSGYKLFSGLNVLDSRLRGSDSIDSGSDSDEKFVIQV
jgi:hypothetical protein